MSTATPPSADDLTEHVDARYRFAPGLVRNPDLAGDLVRDLQQISLPAAEQRLRRGRMMLVSALAAGADRRERLRGVPVRCWDARQRVSDFVDGALDPETSAMLEVHLTTCPTCPPLYAALVDAHERLADVRDPDTVIRPPLEVRLREIAEGRLGT